MKRLVLIFILGNFVALALAIFVNIGLGLLILALLHALLSSIVIRPGVGEIVFGLSYPQSTQEKLMRIGHSMHYKLYWVVMNLFWFGAAIFVIILGFRFIDFI